MDSKVAEGSHVYAPLLRIPLGRPEPKLYGWADVLISRLHTASQIGFMGSAAYKYLNVTRRIEQEVILAAPIGAVPTTIDWAPIEKAVADRIKVDAHEFALQDQDGILRGTRKPNAEPSFNSERESTFAETAIMNLKKLLEISKGWVMFFYKSGADYTSINFRKPEAKEFKNFRPTPKKGCFYLSPYSLPSPKVKPQDDYLEGATCYIPAPVRPPEPAAPLPKGFNLLDRTILGVEGEVNLLQLFSVILRYGYSKGVAAGRIINFHGIAFGGSSDPDFDAVQKLQHFLTRENDDGTERVPEFVLCHDDDEAGEAVVDKLEQKMFAFVFHVPDDLDAFLRERMDAAPVGTNRDLYALEAMTPHLLAFYYAYRDLSVLATQIADLRATKMLPHVREKLVVEELMKDLSMRGEFYTDGNYGYVFRSDTSELIQWIPSPEVYSFLDTLNLAVKQKLTDLVLAQVAVKLMTQGEKVKIHQFSHYCVEKKKTYINIGDNRMVVLGPSGASFESNGYESVLFRCPGMEPFDEKKLQAFGLGKLKMSAYPGTFLDSTFSPGAANMEDPKSFIMLWMLGFLSGDRHSVRPHLILQGETGSGKSMLASKILALFLGADHKPESFASDERDFRAQLTSEPLICLDNIDDVKATERKLDLLAICADRGFISLRKFYTEISNLKVPTTAHLILTTMAAKFLRPDISARSILINFDKRGVTEADKKNPSEIIAEVLDHREEVFTWFLQKLNYAIKAEEKHGAQIPASPIRLREFHRMALSYATMQGPEAAKKMNTGLMSLFEHQRNDATNEDPLYLAIQLLIGSDNHKGALTASSLLNALGRVIDIYTPHQAEIKQWNARKLGQQINSQKAILTEKFGMTVERDGHSNGNLYRFEPTLEARENCVRHRTQIDGSLAIMPRQGWGDEDEEASA